MFDSGVNSLFETIFIPTGPVAKILYFVGTFALFFLARAVNKIPQKFTFGIPVFKKLPPIILTAAAIILTLKFLNIDFKIYNSGAKYITYLLGPATIALAVPLVKNREVLCKNKRAIWLGFVFATFAAIVSVSVIGKFFHTKLSVIISMLPKSVTTPIAVEISKTIGGIPELTATAVILTGIIGGLFNRRILKFFKVENDVAIGLSVGASAHVMGTSSLAERKEFKQVAISTVALTIVAILTAVLAPVLIKLYLKLAPVLQMW